METSRNNSRSISIARMANARIMACRDLSAYEYDKQFVPKTREELRRAFMEASRRMACQNG